MGLRLPPLLAAASVLLSALPAAAADDLDQLKVGP